MIEEKETIFALASAFGRAGIAVIRISGDKAIECAAKITGIADFEPRKLKNAVFKNPVNGEVIDTGLAVFFKAPYSFTGENVIELHIHGSRAVINEISDVLSAFDGVRIAEPGEFSRRAVMNGKFDLTAAEGLIDLINSDTQAQRIYALRQKGGELKGLYDSWREVLLKKLAWIEAYIDFPEEDVPQDIMDGTVSDIKNLISLMETHLTNDKGTKLREGFKIAIIGAPNAGKSTLLNALTKKDAAIVSSIPGTTRDVIEVYMEIAGYPVLIADTAGIRDTDEEIESEGIKRAKDNANKADLILFLFDGSKDEDIKTVVSEFAHKESIVIINKSDISDSDYNGAVKISAKTGDGVDALLEKIKDIVGDTMNIGEAPVLTRQRHKQALEESVISLNRAIEYHQHMDMMAEDIRLASRALGKITGQVMVDEVLEIIFSDFCIGK